MKQKIKLNEKQLRQVIKESVKKVLKEINIDTLERAQDKAFKDYEAHMWPDFDSYDEKLADKRYRQYNAFKDRIHQLKSEGGKQPYYVVKPGVPGFYNGEVRKVYMTPEEANNYKDGEVFTSFVDAYKSADYSS